MTAIKLLVELLEGKGAADEAVEFCGAHRPVPSAIIPPKRLWEPIPGGW